MLPCSGTHVLDHLVSFRYVVGSRLQRGLTSEKNPTTKPKLTLFGTLILFLFLPSVSKHDDFFSGPQFQSDLISPLSPLTMQTALMS